MKENFTALKPLNNAMRLLKLLPIIVFAFVSLHGNAQVKWETSLMDQRSFVRNVGQFEGRLGAEGGDALFALDEGASLVVFHPNRITYRLEQKTKNKERTKGDKTKPRQLMTAEIVTVIWEGANSNCIVIEEDATTDYSTYALLNAAGRTVHTDKLYGSRKLVYSNLYPNIDVEYTIHPKQGIKYALVVRPGGDISKVKMKFSDGRVSKIDAQGNLHTSTLFGDIIDHAPVTFYQDNASEGIASAFEVKGNVVGFSLGNYDALRTVVIDPWTITPQFQNSNKVWNIQSDLNSNVYVYGGDTPVRLRKYDALGNLVWSYNTPWDSANYWIGTMITDTVGNSYITSGTSGRVRKINAAGVMEWESPANPLFGPELEFWSLAFNCDQSQLVCGGMRAQSGTNIGSYRGAIMNLSLTDGSITDFEVVGYQNFPTIKEVRSVCASPNGKFYYLTLDSVGSISSNLDIGFQSNSSYNFSYGTPAYGVTNQGVNMIKATTEFIYTQNGAFVNKRYISDGSIIASAAIPGGSSNSTLGNSPNNGGLAIDSCGNVFVGSGNGVYKFDSNLNPLTSVATNGAVYDVNVNRNGEVIACGQGFIISADLDPCFPPVQVCQNCLEVRNAGPFCVTDEPTLLIATPAEGTWEGSGIADANVNSFDPALAGVGVHTIRFAPAVPLACGLDSIQIVVSACGQPEVCLDSLGNFNVYNGSFPYTWQLRDTVLDCSGCPLGVCFPFICPGEEVVVWSSFATGFSAFPPGSWPIRVVDASNNIVLIQSPADVTPCDQACELAVDVVDVVSVCVGETNGAATAVASGNIGNATFVWNTNPEQTTATATGLSSGSYIVNVTDAFGCTNADTAAIVEYPAVIAFAGSDTVICLGDTILLTASGGNSYLWNTGDSVAQISIAPVVTTQFDVLVIGEGACSNSSGVLIVVDERICLGILPNVFNPDTDFEGIEGFCAMVHQNNTFQLACLELYPGNRMRIFDRWGRERYDETNYHLNPWDGDGASDGVYYFVLEVPNIEAPLKGYFHIAH